MSLRRRMIGGEMAFSKQDSDNLIILGECTDGITMPDGREVTHGSSLVTPYFELKQGTYYTNLSRNLPSGITWNQFLYFYDENMGYITAQQLSLNKPYGEIFEYMISNEEVRYGRIMFDIANTSPYFGKSGKL